MKRAFKRIVSLLLAVVMVFGVAPLSGFVGFEIPSLTDIFSIKAEAATYSGECGENLTWVLDTDTGILTITGSGNMLDYSSVSSVPWYNYRSYITSVNLSNGLTSIGSFAFSYCTDITSIIIPYNVTSIGDNAFLCCENLTSITIPESIASIGKNAFYQCFGANIYFIGDIASWCAIDFYEASSNPASNNSNLYINGNLISGELVIPNEVTSIGNYVFYNNKELTNIIISDSVESIGVGAFSACSELKKVTIGNNVKNIGDRAFNSCNGIKELTIPVSAKIYNSSDTFGGCHNIEKVILTKGNGIMQDYGTDTSLSATETYLGYTPWHLSKSKLTEIIIEDGVKNIGNNAFVACNGLTSITIPDSVTNIGDRAFLSCSGIKELTMPVSAKIYNSGDTFGSCSSIEKIILTKGSGIMQDYASDSENYAETYHAFTPWYKSNRKLTEVIIEDGVKNIGEHAFRYCSNLTTITIPDSVTSIEKYAFYRCDNLTDVYYSRTEEEWNEISIKEDNEKLTNATIHFKSSEEPEEEPDNNDKYKNATIILDQNNYTVKEPKSLTIEGTITCPDGVEGLLISWSFDEIDIFYTPSQTTYETVSETEMRFSQTFTPKKAGKFKVYARLPNDAEAECTVTSYQEAVSAFISEHYQFVKSDKYNDFVAEEAAQKMSKAVRGSFNYHWNNAMSWNYFENYYDLVFAELLTGKTMTETAVSTFNKNCAVQTTTISNEFLRFIGEGLKEDETKEFLSLLKSKEFVSGKDTDIYQHINLIIEANKKDITESFFAKYDIIGASNKILSVSTDYVEWAIECIYFYSAVEAYRQTNEEFKAVIKTVAEKTDNKSLKKTLETYISIDEENSSLSFAQYVLENRKTESLITMVKIFYDVFGVDGISKFICGINLKDGTKLGDKVVKVFTKEGTQVGTIAQYVNGAITGITLGMAVSELITNADDYSMNTSKCTHAGDFAEVLLEVLNESASNFKASKTLEDALLFDAAYNLYKDTQIYALNAMVESVYAQNNSVVRLLFNKAESVSAYMSKICKYKYLNCHKHDLTELINAEYYYVDKKYLGNKVLRIACPVDVYVYDSEGNLALSIENDFVEIFDDRLDAFVLNSEKYICVPLDEEFAIKIVSTDDGEMDYAVFEFDDNSEMTRKVSKENITLVNEKTFEGKVDNILNTDRDNYNLTVSGNQEVISMENDIDCVPATNISISKSSVELKVGQDQGLVASISPVNTTDRYVWISSDETVATVSQDGTVNAIGEGNATIVAMVNDLIYAECEVNVVILKDYTVTWNIDGATTLQTITEGNTITKPSNPTKSGYTFVGWSPEVPDTMPSYDLTFTAVFEKSYICPDCGDEILGEDTINNHIASEARMKATVKIKNNSGSKTINYGETLRLTAVTTEMPTDVKIYWYVDGVKKDEGETFNVSFESGTKTVEVKLVDSNGNAIKNASGNEISDSESVTVKGGFFQKLISFFKNLFGVNRTVVQAFKVIF